MPISRPTLELSHVIGIKDITEEDIQKILEYSARIKQNPAMCAKNLKGKILGIAFWEPSTRTRLSFESAMFRLGGQITGFSSSAGTSLEKGESLSDTIHMLAGYTDGIVMRHPSRGSGRLAARIADKYNVPVISGGSGSQEHPTQALLDIFTIKEQFKRLSGLTIGMMGDLRYSRTISSLLFALSKFGRNKIYLLSHPLLGLQEELKFDLENTKLELDESINGLADIIEELDVLYVTRLQKERFPDPFLFEKVKGAFELNPSLMKVIKPDLMIMHPLPRIDEIPYDIDRTNQAKYFDQALNGVYVRMALLDLLLGSRQK
ncbi:MAG: aspartate carbamoyltransferase [Candidatus Hodarchaeota archaeon]